MAQKDKEAGAQRRVSGAAGPQALAEMLERHLAGQAELCVELEALADTLPEKVDRLAMLEIAQRIAPVMQASHDFEENVLYPTLRRISFHDASIVSTLARLRSEHCEDEGYAGELAESMAAFVADPVRANAEMLAYMLRGFFQCLRRHIAFEREHIVPLLTRASG